MLLLKDGAIGLIDYGCFKELDDRQLKMLAELYDALDRRDENAAAEACGAIGFRSRDGGRALAFAFATQCFDRDVADCSPYKFLQDLERTDPILAIPRDYMLVTPHAAFLLFDTLRLLVWGWSFSVVRPLGESAHSSFLLSSSFFSFRFYATGRARLSPPARPRQGPASLSLSTLRVWRTLGASDSSKVGAPSPNAGRKIGVRRLSCAKLWRKDVSRILR